MADWDELLGSLRALIIAVSDALPERDLASAWELVDAGEPGVALENLCTQLYEYEVVVEPTIIARIRELASQMNMDGDRLVDGLG